MNKWFALKTTKSKFQTHQSIEKKLGVAGHWSDCPSIVAVAPSRKNTIYTIFEDLLLKHLMLHPAEGINLISKVEAEG